MNNNMEIIKDCQYKKTFWSGGMTTELAIFPPDAQYSERNFKWRLSSATVQIEESIFTHLPGISRIIMVIEGKLILKHEGKHSAALNPFETDSFMGDWTTKCFGKATDFNLMMAEGCSGELDSYIIGGRKKIDICLRNTSAKHGTRTDAFYVVNGNAEIHIQNEKYYVNNMEMLCITRPAGDEELDIVLYNDYNDELRIVRAGINY